MVDDKNATPQPGLFAAVDVTTAFAEQVLIAIGEGARRGQRVRVFFSNISPELADRRQLAR